MWVNETKRDSSGNASQRLRELAAFPTQSEGSEWQGVDLSHSTGIARLGIGHLLATTRHGAPASDRYLHFRPKKPRPIHFGVFPVVTLSSCIIDIGLATPLEQTGILDGRT
jgi:hypothetical protein